MVLRAYLCLGRPLRHSGGARSLLFASHSRSWVTVRASLEKCCCSQAQSQWIVHLEVPAYEELARHDCGCSSGGFLSSGL